MIYLIYHLVYKYSLAWTVETGPRDTMEANQRHPSSRGSHSPEGGSDFENHLANVELQLQQGL